MYLLIHLIHNVIESLDLNLHYCFQYFDQSHLYIIKKKNYRIDWNYFKDNLMDIFYQIYKGNDHLMNDLECQILLDMLLQEILIDLDIIQQPVVKRNKMMKQIWIDLDQKHG